MRNLILVLLLACSCNKPQINIIEGEKEQRNNHKLNSILYVGLNPEFSKELKNSFKFNLDELEEETWNFEIQDTSYFVNVIYFVSDSMILDGYYLKRWKKDGLFFEKSANATYDYYLFSSKSDEVRQNLNELNFAYGKVKYCFNRGHLSSSQIHCFEEQKDEILKMKLNDLDSLVCETE